MKVFVGKHCIPCKKLKEWLSSEDIPIKCVFAEDNLQEVNKLGIRSVPTLVLNDNSLIKGLDSIIEYLNKKEKVNECK